MMPVRPSMLATLFAAVLFFDLLAVFVYNRLVSGHIHAEAEFFAKAEPQRLDAVIVFCNGIGPYNGVDETTRSRLARAAEIVQAGRARAVAGIGCHWKVNEDEPAGMAGLLREFGLPDDRIFVDEGSFDTASNWIESRAIIARENWRRLYLLSSPLHLFRIGWLIDQETPADELEGLHLRPLPFTPPHADNPWAVYKEVHHEALAWAGRLLLPQSIFRSYLRWRRK